MGGIPTCQGYMREDTKDTSSSGYLCEYTKDIRISGYIAVVIKQEYWRHMIYDWVSDVVESCVSFASKILTHHRMH